MNDKHKLRNRAPLVDFALLKFLILPLNWFLLNISLPDVYAKCMIFVCAGRCGFNINQF